MTDTGNVKDAAGLRATSVRVEVSVSQRLIESEQAGVREDRLRVLGIVGGEKVRLAVGEQRTGRVQTDDGVQLTVLVLARVGGNVCTEAVTDQVNVVPRRTGSRNDRVDHARNDLTDGTDTVASGDVVDRLRACTPVNIHDVELTDADVVILDAPVQAGILALQESVDEEARRVCRIEVASRHRRSAVPVDHLGVDRVAARVQAEDDVRFGVEQWLDLIVARRNIVRVHVDQMQSTLAVRNQGPRADIQRGGTDQRSQSNNS
uniref:Uncharacterized protein n=1 Tax=Anopheles atroparvus TaxID=41427 RepID=A0A182IIZ0_ANOAO